MKNVLLIIQKLYNGGAERAISILADTLKNDYNVIMVVFDGKNQEYNPNVKIIDLKIPDSKNILKKIIYGIKRIKKVKKLKKNYNIDCSISFLSGPNLVNCLSGYKDKKIISIRNMQSKLKKSNLRDIVNQITLKKADTIVTVSKSVEEDIKKRYKVDNNKIITIYNMIEKSSKNNRKIENVDLLKDEDINIINVGRLILQKGQWHLIKAFKIVKEKIPNAKLFILGRGELENDFKKLISILNLQNNVFLLGYKTNINDYLSYSDLFVSTSIYEGMSNVILEAMNFGLPIIATDCLGGTKEILSPTNYINDFVKNKTEAEYGILIPPLNEKYDISDNISNDEYKLAETIVELISNKEKSDYYKEMSLKRIKDFTNLKIKEEWKKILDNT